MSSEEQTRDDEEAPAAPAAPAPAGPPWGLSPAAPEPRADGKQPSLLQHSPTVKRFSPLWRQSLAASASILLTFATGLAPGYSAVLLPQLAAGGPIPSDEETASWIAAMSALPMAPGCLVSGWLMERCGRRRAHLLICAPLLAGWVLVACASSLPLMLLGRFLTGLCLGLLGPLGPVYVAETTSPLYRGFFLASISLALAIGILFVHTVGTFISWQSTAAVCAVFPVLSAMLLLAVPESPTWLVSKGRTEEAAKNFTSLRGFDDEAIAEFKNILARKEAADLEPELTLREKLDKLRGPELVKPLMIMTVFFITAQFSGVNAVAFYSIQIVEKSVGKGLNHYLAMLIIDVVRVVMSAITCVVSRKYGRRTLCFISGTWTALSMIGLSMFLYFTDGKAAAHMAWIPLSCLMSYICAVSIGLVPLPWVMCGELFPTKVRGVGSGVSSAISLGALFVVVKTAPGMMSGLGEVVTFLIYGSVAAVGTFSLYFILPETKGKSLEEIEDRFKGNFKSESKI